MTDSATGMAPKLYRFQRAGVEFLIKRRRAILADDMGLGKTVQAITACETQGLHRILVVCPNTLKTCWANEISRWAPGRYAKVLRGNYATRGEDASGFRAGYLITNIESLRKPRFVNVLASLPWDALIVDEAHGLKNRKASQTRGARALAHRIPRVYLLTGTPILNKVNDLWSPLNILYPRHYRSFWRFVQRHTIVTKDFYGWRVDGKPTRPTELKRELSPILLRRSKEEIFPDMPRIVYQKLWLDMDGPQRDMYRAIERGTLVGIGDGDEISVVNALAKLTRCRQVTTSPALLNGPSIGVKFEALLDVINGTDQKIVVFSQFAEAIKLVTAALTERGIATVTLIGETKEVMRNASIDLFQRSSEVKVLAATTQAGGFGITLTSAGLVIFLDKHWTPAVNRQAVDRTRPHMQKRSVQVIELLCRDSVDEIIEKVLAGKASIVEAILERKERICQA